MTEFYQPKGSMCANCKHVDENCSDLNFIDMPVIEKMEGILLSIYTVKCTNFERKK